MNRPIVIQWALESEISYLLDNLDIKNETHLGGFLFYECIYKNYPIVVSKTKMGEIPSATTTTLAIEKYNPLFILNQGTAGAFVEWLNKGDVVVGKQVYYLSHFSTDKDKENNDINPWKKSEYKTIDNETISYKSDEKLLNWLQNLEILEIDNIYFDIIGSGDVWTKDINMMKKYNSDHGIVWEAMECSGAYLAANNLGISLVSIRAISNNEIKNQEYDESISIISQKITISVIDEFIKSSKKKY